MPGNQPENENYFVLRMFTVGVISSAECPVVVKMAGDRG
jgi:hypothetical protein